MRYVVAGKRELYIGSSMAPYCCVRSRFDVAVAMRKDFARCCRDVSLIAGGKEEQGGYMLYI